MRRVGPMLTAVALATVMLALAAAPAFAVGRLLDVSTGSTTVGGIDASLPGGRISVGTEPTTIGGISVDP